MPLLERVEVKNSEIREKDRQQITVGFSPTPTLYRLQWHGGPRQGQREYVRCGADILLSGLTGDLEAEARCPVCGKFTKLLIVDRKIGGLEPKDAVLHVVEMPGEAGRIWVECEATHVFDRDLCFWKWVSTYSGKKGLVTSIEKYNDLIVRRRTTPQRIVPITRTEPSEVRPSSEHKSSESE